MFHCVMSRDAKVVRLRRPKQKLAPKPRNLLILKPSKPDDLNFLLYSLVGLSFRERNFWNPSIAFLWNHSAATHFPAFRDTDVLSCPITGVRTLPCIWPTNSAPHTGCKGGCGIHVIHTQYKDRGPTPLAERHRQCS